MGKKNRGCCGNFLWIFVISGIVCAVLYKDDPKENNVKTEIVKETDAVKKETEKPKKETENVKKETEKKINKTFVGQLAEYTNNEIAEEVQRIYKEELGFDTVEFDKKMDGVENYYIWAGTHQTVATIMDGYYRIFIPNTNYVFYDDGNVLLTAAEFEDSLISNEDMVWYYDIAKEIVKSCLKSPSTADFPGKSEITYQKKENLVAIQGYVDAINSFNAEIRSEYLVQFYVYDLKNFSYETTYIQIDGETSGTFVEF